jgi:DNA-binding NarL/FixJ family response regulator
VARGDSSLHPAVTRRVLQELVPPRLDIPPAPSREQAPDALIEPLTSRELEVLALLGNHLTNKEVARTLRISWRTVTKHAGNIYQKLQVANRREAVRRGLTLRLISSTNPSGAQPARPARENTRGGSISRMGRVVNDGG